MDQLATIKTTLLEQAEAYDRLPSTSAVHAPPISQSSSRSPGSTASNVPHRTRPPQPSRASPPDPPETPIENGRYGVDESGRRSARYADDRIAQSNSRSQLPAPVLEYAREEQRRRTEDSHCVGSVTSFVMTHGVGSKLGLREKLGGPCGSTL